MKAFTSSKALRNYISKARKRLKDGYRFKAMIAYTYKGNKERKPL